MLSSSNSTGSSMTSTLTPQTNGGAGKPFRPHHFASAAGFAAAASFFSRSSFPFAGGSAAFGGGGGREEADVGSPDGLPASLIHVNVPGYLVHTRRSPYLSRVTPARLCAESAGHPPFRL